MDTIPSFQEIVTQTNWSEFFPTIIGVVVGALFALMGSLLLYRIQVRSEKANSYSDLKNNIVTHSLLYFNLRFKYQELDIRIAEYDGYVKYFARSNSYGPDHDKTDYYQTLKHETIMQKDTISVKVYEVQAQLESFIHQLKNYSQSRHLHGPALKAYLDLVEFYESDYNDLKDLTQNHLKFPLIDNFRKNHLTDVADELKSRMNTLIRPF